MLTLIEQLRAGHVNRWQIVQTARPQTLAEHSFHVSAIAGELALLSGWEGMEDPDRRLKLIVWGLYHDLIEVKTGDLASPFKECLRQAGGAGIIQDAEKIADEEYFDLHMQMKGTEVEAMVKIADLIEAAYFLQDNGLGTHAKEVLQGIYRSIRELANSTVEDFPNIKLYFATQVVCERILRERVFL